MRATFGEVAVENLGISSDIGRAQNSDGLMAARRELYVWPVWLPGSVTVSLSLSHTLTHTLSPSVSVSLPLSLSLSLSVSVSLCLSVCLSLCVCVCVCVCSVPALCRGSEGVWTRGSLYT